MVGVVEGRRRREVRPPPPQQEAPWEAPLFRRRLRPLPRTAEAAVVIVPRAEDAATDSRRQEKPAIPAAAEGACRCRSGRKRCWWRRAPPWRLRPRPRTAEVTAVVVTCPEDAMADGAGCQREAPAAPAAAAQELLQPSPPPRVAADVVARAVDVAADGGGRRREALLLPRRRQEVRLPLPLQQEAPCEVPLVGVADGKRRFYRDGGRRRDRRCRCSRRRHGGAAALSASDVTAGNGGGRRPWGTASLAMTC